MTIVPRGSAVATASTATCTVVLAELQLPRWSCTAWVEPGVRPVMTMCRCEPMPDIEVVTLPSGPPPTSGRMANDDGDTGAIATTIGAGGAVVTGVCTGAAEAAGGGTTACAVAPGGLGAEEGDGAGAAGCVEAGPLAM